ncbi:iron-containing alcohol dehydrogenase family protein [Haloprofundus sp. MHR1]|uniref:iron-containing alcohol dehydrogenase family protein n=1 Tax=Haloprofundus sp. MHR1 TaxID=2572921 RepID=UPI0010BEB820|nr:iron-containing alcohol dehydrogenase family protein [Haloprofundus sp. MHR1]QCJ47105.1 iron-containing alcohol dehydrogenase [Haloprofundus sp. MHR1]
MVREHRYEAARFVWGENAIGRLDDLLPEAGVERAMVVCGEHVGANEELMGAVEDALGERHVYTYTGARGDTPLRTVEAGVEVFRDHNADGLVSVGGGSASDTAKAISVFAAENDRDLHEMKTQTTEDGESHVPELPATKTPVFAVSTTLSAAEVSNIFGVTDEEAGDKAVVLDEKIRPQACIYDSAATATTPPATVASTGMNALDHAVEILYSDGHAENPFYQATAEKAIDLLVTNLPAAVNDGDADALVDAQLGAGLSGLGIVGGISINHGINHPLCARHPVSHGDGNSILLPHGIRFTYDAVPERMARLATALGVEVEGDSATDEATLEAMCDVVRDLQEEIGVPYRLRDVGVDRDDFEAMAKIAAHDSAMANNPKRVTESDIVDILEAAW